MRSILEHHLNEWIQKGFLTHEQFKKISDYENQKSNRSWILTGLLALGGAVICIGIISLIAANWHEIPDGVKLFFNFLLLAGLAFAILKFYPTPQENLTELLLLIFLGLLLASIGLHSQIFHTSGKTYQATLLWSFISIGVPLMARKIFISFFWVSTLIISFIFAADDLPFLREIFHHQFQAVFLFTTLMSFCMSQVGERFFPDNFILASFRIWILITAPISMAIIEFHNSFALSKPSQYTFLFPIYPLSLFALYLIKTKPQYNSIQKLLLLFSFFVFLVPFHAQLFFNLSGYFYAFCSVALLALVVLLMASLKEQFLFQFFLFFLGVRFFVLYIQAFGGLIATGVGLIFTGLIIIVCAYYWNQYRVKLSETLARWLNA